ncbi:hypothetical protein [Nocardioides cynanchi]|uniref:hypothetical protein n=1 Tax=Nocardioides cynanchi TaxID=2558918 RepID=UPI001244EE5E|nr:hypothetical protein [Nocardioides cynanchi]
MSWRRILLVAFALAVINLPWATHEVRMHQVTTSGIQVSAQVLTVARAGGDTSLVTFRLPSSVDPAQKSRTAVVDRATADAAAAGQTIGVRVMKGNPDVFHVDGQVKSWSSTVLVVVADLVVVLLVLLSWRLGGRLRRPTLVAVALADVESGTEGSLLDKQLDGTYVINGAVRELLDAETLVLTLRDRDVELHLRGHANPVPVGEQAQVLAHLVG